MKKAIVLILFIAGLIGTYFILVINPCLKSAKNTKQSFEMVFYPNSNQEELLAFAKIFKENYPDVIIEKIITEEKFIDTLIDTNNLSSDQIEKIKQELVKKSLLRASIMIKGSVSDLGTLDDFNSFVSQELKKYGSLKLKGYTGTVPENLLTSNDKSFSFCVSPKLILKVFTNPF